VTSRVDLAVIGAGPAAAAAANSAARCGLRVVLIGPLPVAGRPVQSVSPEGIVALERLGVTGLCKSVWFPGVVTPNGFQAFKPDQSGQRLGVHLDREAMDMALCLSAVRAGTTWVEKAVLDLRREAGVFTVECAGGAAYKAERVVLATGRRRHLADRLGIRPRALSMPLLVASGQRRVSRTRGSSAYLLPGPDSWLWTVPLDDDGWVAWTSVAAAGTRSAKRLAEAGRVSAATWLLSGPAGGAGWFAAGDAVCALDPSWGNGIQFALSSGEAAGMASATALAEYDPDRRRTLELHYSDDLRASTTAQAAILASSWRKFSPQWARETHLGIRRQLIAVIR
jgi:flavin-dependent dehydrogenase